MNIAGVAWKELSHRRSSLVSGLVAITLGIAVIVGIRSVTVASGARSDLRAELEQLTGEVVITSQPPGAEVLLDGNSIGTTDQTIVLPTRAHEVVIRLAGFVPFKAAVTPKEVGLSLYGPYLLAVELASMLLLSGLVGAYHLGRRFIVRKEGQ